MKEKSFPVIVGVGEVVDRIEEPLSGKEPLELMELALMRAEKDAGAQTQKLVSEIDCLDIVAEYSWPYENPTRQLARRIGATPGHANYGETGGETPLRYVNEAAIRIAEGECKLAAVVGAEATYSVTMAEKKNVDLPWTPCVPDEPYNPANSIARRYGAELPPSVYPFYENAALANWGLTQREGLRESGNIWSRMSEVASANPYAWIRHKFSAEDITTPNKDNRLIAWPYTKRMIANPMVNQGAALLITSVNYAKRLGITADKMVYVKAGASASDDEDFLKRDQFSHSHAQDVVLERALELSGESEKTFDFVELYSCFPCVPKMARRKLGLSEYENLTVAGGLSFFGAPLNNYMSHATANSVRNLRGKTSECALLYGQGGYVTKHHVLILSSNSVLGGKPELLELSSEAARRRQSIPPLRESYEGPGILETFTILYSRTGKPQQGIVVVLTPEGNRVMAGVQPEDTSTLALLTDLDSNPIGRQGHVTRVKRNWLEWALVSH